MGEQIGDGARILLPDDVRSLLPWKTAIEAMRAMFQDLGEARAGQPPRVVMPVPDSGGVLGLMPSWARPRGRARPVMAVKTISVFNANRARGLESHQGAVLLFDGEDGRLLAVVDATSLTAVRTAAVTALATDILASKDARSLALLGSGTQAHLHLSALQAVRGIDRVWVWSPTPAHRQALAAAARAMGLEAHAAEDAKSAVAEAEIVTTLTPARTPILHEEWLRGGAHVNAVGASIPGFRELDAKVVERAAVYVDWREAALREADDVRLPIEDGIVPPEHVQGDLTDLVRGLVTARPRSPLTLFKSVGLALEDAYAALFVLEGAQREGRGHSAAFQSRRD